MSGQRKEKDVHLFMYPSRFQFFGNTEHINTLFLELAPHKYYNIEFKEKTRFRETYDKLTDVNPAIKDNIVLSANSAFRALTFEQFTKEIDERMSFIENVKSLTLVTGCLAERFSMELRWYKNYMKVRDDEELRKKPLEDVFGWISTLNLAQPFLVMMYICDKFGPFKINNFVDDSLQYKYPYLVERGFDVRHLHYHKMKDDTFTDPDGNQYKYEYFPFIHYWYFHRYKTFQKVKQQRLQRKKYLFTFGMSDSSPILRARGQMIRNLLHLVNEPNCKFFFKTIDKELKEYQEKNNLNDWVDYSEYLDLIDQSRFTLNIPSYSDQVFSPRRWMEAVQLDCLPLVLDTTQYEAGFNFDEELIGIIKEHCLISMDDLKNITSICESIDSTEVIKKIKACRQVKLWQNPEFYKAFVNKYEL